MVSNLIKDLQTQKQQLKEYAVKAHEFGWIDEQRKTEIIQKLDNDTLIIGVIGQMKCGKSTFLNAFIFEDDILPVASTTMTASLSVIEYGHEKKIDVEFYTQAEWAELEKQAKRDMFTISDEVELSKVKAAQECVSMSSALGDSVFQYLGRKKEDTLDNLIEYVGADGKYVSITKSVTIYSPKEYLKGVEIVDTPGFNDPLVSREERTKDFLRRADVVLLMLYAGRPYDATDRAILFQTVKSCGTGKVMIGINKYDTAYENNPDLLTELQDYVKEEIAKDCQKCNERWLVDILQNIQPIALSALMALLSQLPNEKIESDEKDEKDYKFHWDQLCKRFNISTPEEFREGSNMDELTTAVKEMVEKEKEEILFSKMRNTILAKGRACKEKVEGDLMACRVRINAYNTPKKELEEHQANLQKATDWVDRRITFLSRELESAFNDLTYKANNELEDIVKRSCYKMKGIVYNDWKRSQTTGWLKNQLQDEFWTLRRELEKEVSERQEKARKTLSEPLRDFFDRADEKMLKYLPGFEQEDFLKDVQYNITFQLDKEAFKLDVSMDEWIDFENQIWIKRIWTHNDNADKIATEITNFRENFDPDKFTQCLIDDKDRIIAKVKQKYQQELLAPIQKAFDAVSEQSLNKEIELENLRKQKEELLKQKEMVVGQITEMESLMKTSQE